MEKWTLQTAQSNPNLENVDGLKIGRSRDKISLVELNRSNISPRRAPSFLGSPAPLPPSVSSSISSSVSSSSVSASSSLNSFQFENIGMPPAPPPPLVPSPSLSSISIAPFESLRESSNQTLLFISPPPPSIESPSPPSIELSPSNESPPSIESPSSSSWKVPSNPHVIGTSGRRLVLSAKLPSNLSSSEDDAVSILGLHTTGGDFIHPISPSYNMIPPARPLSPETLIQSPAEKYSSYVKFLRLLRQIPSFSLFGPNQLFVTSSESPNGFQAQLCAHCEYQPQLETNDRVMVFWLDRVDFSTSAPSLCRTSTLFYSLLFWKILERWFFNWWDQFVALRSWHFKQWDRRKRHPFYFLRYPYSCINSFSLFTYLSF